MPRWLLEERAVNQQGPALREADRAAACLQFRGASRAGYSRRGHSRCSSTVAGLGDKGDLSPPLPSRPGRRDGRPRGDGCQWGGDGGGGGRFGGSGGLVSGSRLPGLPALRAPGAGAQPELAADGLLRHEGLRLQGPPGDAAQTPGGTDAARRAAPAGPGPGRRP